MIKGDLFVLLSIFTLIILIVPIINSCGCGIAISDMKVFNSLKETQAYLLIDVENQNSYNELPFLD